MHQKRCFRFDPTSFFPKFDYEDILEMEFNIAWYLKGYQVNNDKDFGELYWLFNRLKEKIKEENDNTSGLQEQFNNLNN